VLAYVMQGGGRGSVQEVPEPTVGDYDAAVAAYRDAATHTANVPEQRYLREKAAALGID